MTSLRLLYLIIKFLFITNGGSQYHVYSKDDEGEEAHSPFDQLKGLAAVVKIFERRVRMNRVQMLDVK